MAFTELGRGRSAGGYAHLTTGTADLRASSATMKSPAQAFFCFKLKSGQNMFESADPFEPALIVFVFEAAT
jgi:hypothetical protein